MTGSNRLAPLRRHLGAWYAPRPDGWLEVAVAGTLALIYFALLSSTLEDLGYARDEGFYFQAATRYQAWFELLWRDRATALAQVDEHWSFNHEHPALVKSLFALSHLFVWDRWRLVAMEGTSFRLPAMLLSSLGVGLVYLWGARARGRMVGLTAAISLAAMPRFFFHAHLACFDGPIVTLWLACAYAYWRALGRGGLGRYVLVGISFGLALNTKHNSWFLPIVFVLHALALELPGLGRGLDRAVLRRRALAALVAMALLGPLLLYAGWPWIWHQTGERLTAYARFHLEHVYYNMEFLGRNYWRPPMPIGYAFVMTAATVPTVTLVAWATGVIAALRADLGPPLGALARRFAPARWSRATERPPKGGGIGRGGIDPATTTLWLLAMGVQYGAWLSPGTPIFGGTKHWMTAYPFLALLAGVGLSALARGARIGWARRLWRQQGGGRCWLHGSLLEAALLGAVTIAPMVQAAHAHPFGLSSYTPLVGGAPGGADRGLNRGFWGYTTGAVTDYLDAEVPRGGRVYAHDTARPAWEMLQRDGRLRADIQGTWNVAAADFSVYHHEMHMAGEEYQAWVIFGTRAPAHVAGLDGVPVVWIYRRPVDAPRR
jgi:4-amino-4-deoxy-L-arabinose transferase-like glycosyltransferase